MTHAHVYYNNINFDLIRIEIDGLKGIINNFLN